MTLVWSPQDLVAATGGTWLREPPPGWAPTGFCYAAVLFRPGDMLFVRRDNQELGFSPHHAAVLAAQASGVICSRPELAPPGPCLVVPDCREALYALARYGRGRFRGRLFAVTGSAGKTSTCDMLAHVLAGQGAVAATSHNTNLPAGVARILAALPHDSDHAVLELAIGRMARSTRLARPHVAIFTTIAPAHLEYHDTLEVVAERKSAIFQGLEPGGVAVVNRDMPVHHAVLDAAGRHAARIITFGVHGDSESRLLDYTPDHWVRALVDGAELEYRMGLPGRHMAVNSLAVLSAVAAAGLDMRRAAESLAHARPVEGRGRQYGLRLDSREFVLIDDAYNANPVSMRACIAVLADAVPQRGGRRVAVLGQMLELGPDSARYHAELAEPLIDAKVDQVYLVGEMMAHLWDRLSHGMRAARLDSADGLAERLAAELQDGDVIAAKGSHGSNVHEAVEALRRLAEAAD